MTSSKFKLSKSSYVKGHQCKKYLWLSHHNPEQAAPPSSFQESIFKQGHEVEFLARKLFPNGVSMAPSQLDVLHQTQDTITHGASVIYEAAFSYQDVLIRADIIARNPDNTWDLYEVKSTTKIRKESKDKALKPQYMQDVSIQKWVMEGAGIKIKRCHIIYLNSKYIRGRELDLKSLFIIESVDSDIAIALGDVPKLVLDFLAILKGTQPEVDIGSQCNNPYECPYKSKCWKDVGPISIHCLTRITDTKRKNLKDLGVNDIKDIPISFELTANQQIQMQAVQNKLQINLHEIKKFMTDFEEPLYFLDFETIGYAIPRYQETTPYQKLTFQYSIHVLHNGSLGHSEFFYEQDSDPSRKCAENLIRELRDVGSIVAYHKSFEAGQIRDLAERFTDLAPALNNIENRLIDLEVPFAKFWYCDGRFEGRSSIKKVLPILIPTLSYEGLSIQKGEEAQRAYLEFLGIIAPLKSSDEIREDLLNYCKLDTLAMVEIYNVLKAISN